MQKPELKIYSGSLPRSIRRSRVKPKVDENSTTKKRKSKQKSNKKSTDVEEPVSKFTLGEPDINEKLQVENFRLKQLLKKRDERIEELEKLNENLKKQLSNRFIAFEDQKLNMSQCQSQFFSPDNKLLFSEGGGNLSNTNQMSRRMNIAPLPDLKDKLSRTRAQSTHGSQRLKLNHKKKFTSLDHEANTSMGDLS